MEDAQIITLLFDRSERAMEELAAKYGALLRCITSNLLPSGEDAQECINDTYLALWNAIPPERPDPLCAYVCAVCRNLSLKRRRDDSARKRDSSFDRSMEELAETLGTSSTEALWAARELGREIDRFLDTLDRESRVLFVRRYWFGDSVEELSRAFHISKNNVSVRLSRIREKLRRHLLEQGVYDG